MQHHALDERLDLCATLSEAGPDAPTLCGGWSTAQLAAHLVRRERSVVELAGRLPVASLRQRAERGIDAYVAATDYAAIVATLQAGPPAWTPYAAAPVRELVNLLEYVVHHEDVRRAGGETPPRLLPVARQHAVWQRLRLAAPATLHGLPVGVELVWPSHGSLRTRRARRDGVRVTVTGEPVELALVAFGRQRAAVVDYSGSAADVMAVRGASIAV